MLAAGAGRGGRSWPSCRTGTSQQASTAGRPVWPTSTPPGSWTAEEHLQSAAEAEAQGDLDLAARFTGAALNLTDAPDAGPTTRACCSRRASPTARTSAAYPRPGVQRRDQRLSAGRQPGAAPYRSWCTMGAGAGKRRPRARHGAGAAAGAIAASRATIRRRCWTMPSANTASASPETDGAVRSAPARASAPPSRRIWWRRAWIIPPSCSCPSRA